MSNLTIVMYHYVRELKRSRYPEIKGLPFETFKEQVAYLGKHYYFVSARDLVECMENGSDLPKNAALLTFDDGYLDHFQYVFPVLDKEMIPACFFPSGKCILERKLLSVNKIHFILASVQNKSQIVQHICDAVDTSQPDFSLPKSESFLENLRKPGRFDTADVVFIKRMLQRDLPEVFRDAIIDDLFTRFVSKDEAAFAQELYMTTEQVECLKRNGMYIGSHGYDHYWLDTLSHEELTREIERSLYFLQQIGSDTRNWIMCYPYGAYNEAVLRLLKQKGCSLGLTTEPRVASWGKDDFLILPRLDTNDILKVQGED